MSKLNNISNESLKKLKNKLLSVEFKNKKDKNIFLKPLYIENIKNTQVAPSSHHGFGLFATKAIKQGTLLCSLTGQIVDEDIYKKFYSLGLSKEIFIEKSKVLKDKIFVIPFRTSYSFINHHPAISHIEEHFCCKTNQINVFAKVDIPANTEILDTYSLKGHIDVLGGFSNSNLSTKD